MPIIYNKLHAMLKLRGTTLYKLNKAGVIGGKTKEVLFGRAEGNINVKTIEALCEVLDCQPGDLMEYVKAPGVVSTQDTAAGEP